MWRKCTRGCGRCMVNVRDRQFLFIEPENILEWARNVIDMVDDMGSDMKGVPLTYYITCTYGAVVSDIISPPESFRYNKSNGYKKDLYMNVISTLSSTMILYSLGRQDVLYTGMGMCSTLSTRDILLFKQQTLRQQRFDVIHAMINMISIAQV